MMKPLNELIFHFKIQYGIFQENGPQQTEQRKNFSDMILSLTTRVSQRLVMLHYSKNILCIFLFFAASIEG